MRGWMLVGSLALAGCYHKSDDVLASDNTVLADANAAAADAIAAADAAQEAMDASPNHAPFPSQPSPYTASDWQSFDTPCTDDCSGHDAGYRWAEANGIETPDDCSGNSQSFIEGCEQYAEEQQPQEEDREDYQ